MNILIVKIGALGDVLRTSFMAQALKDKYLKYDPKIYWLTDKKAIPLFIGNSYINNIFSIENKNKLKKINFDLVVNLEEGQDICKFVNSLHPKKIIGFIHENGKIIPSPTIKEWYNMSMLGPKPQNDILKKKNKKTHRQIMSEIIEVDYKKYEPFLKLTKKQKEFAFNFLRRYNLSKTDLIIGINTGSAERWPKQLSIKKTVDIIDKLYKKYKAKILLFGGPNEVNRNQKILQLSKSPIISTGCGNDLFEFPSLISICNLFITCDTLGFHISLALKRKTIVLVGPTSPAELDMYKIGEKIVAKSNCICCYRSDCKSMKNINVGEIMARVDKLLKQKITFLITAFKESNLGKAIESAINQKTEYNYQILISAPDKETLDIAKSYAKKNKNISIYKDPGKGKSFALNLIFDKIETDILILTDGDVYLNDAAVQNIVNLFLNSEIGCVTGRPVPMEDKSTKYGYWANLLFNAAHKLRKDAFKKEHFLECSGYLFAFRKKLINQIPLDVAEDTVIPYFFWEKGYKIGYAENALVFVKNVDNLNDWIKQKTRTSKAHETLYKYVNIKSTPRVKTFSTESNGIFQVLKYPKDLKEILWTFQLIFARLYMWMNVLYDTKLNKKYYQDNWERIESTKQNNNY